MFLLIFIKYIYKDNISYNRYLQLHFALLFEGNAMRIYMYLNIDMFIHASMHLIDEKICKLTCNLQLYNTYTLTFAN